MWGHAEAARSDRSAPLFQNFTSGAFRSLSS